MRDAWNWRPRWTLTKKWADTGAVFDILVHDGNLLAYGGASALFDLLVAGGSVTAFNAANAYLGVGNSSTAPAAGQTDLQGASKARAVMDAGYPAHTDGTGAGAASCEWQATFASGAGNFAWNEAGLFNAAAAGRMVNRALLNAAWGTKTNGMIWTLKLTVTLS